MSGLAVDFYSLLGFLSPSTGTRGVSSFLLADLSSGQRKSKHPFYPNAQSIRHLSNVQIFTFDHGRRCQRPGGFESAPPGPHRSSQRNPSATPRGRDHDGGAVQVRLPSVSLPSASPHKLPLRPGPAHRPEARSAVPITRDCRTKHAGHRDRLVWRHTQ